MATKIAKKSGIILGIVYCYVTFCYVGSYWLVKLIDLIDIGGM